MNLISLREAKRLGLKRYFTGKPCTLGHISERTTSNRSCLECHKEKEETWRFYTSWNEVVRKAISIA